jgi:hypothetical protein
MKQKKMLWFPLPVAGPGSVSQLCSYTGNICGNDCGHLSACD